MISKTGPSVSGFADQILQSQRAAADRIMLSMMVFLLAVSFGVGWVTDSLQLALLVGLPAWLVPAAIYRMAPGSLASRLAIAFALMVALSDWRRERIFAYLDPWDAKHALGKGFQLSHSLIAFGRGEIFGVGLGGSVEKLHWLPEAHTDFLLAVIGEEFGLLGVLALLGLFMWLTRRIIHIGRQSIALDRLFPGLVAQGVGIWIGFQAFINMGVNLGALPTKGLTLPLMSYGGSAILMNMVALAVVLRIDHENRVLMQRGGRL